MSRRSVPPDHNRGSEDTEFVRRPGQTVAALVAGYLRWHGVQRVYGLCGGHIQPIWDELARLGVAIIDVRHECAAVYMAHAEAELTGRPAVALVTAGPGLTNAVTGLANASVSRAPVLLLSGRPPRPQTGRGALQELPQRAIVAPLCRAALTADRVSEVLPRLDEAVLAAAGWEAPPGPAYLDFPTDLLTEQVQPRDTADWVPAPTQPPEMRPSPGDLARAGVLIAAARRPVVIAGREARAAAPELNRLLAEAGILYLDSGESRGVLPPDHPSVVSAARGRAMREADLVITLDRNLNFQLAYGSSAAFNPAARFLRVARYASQFTDNRRGDVELQCSVTAFVAALADGLRPAILDEGWTAELREAHQAATRKLAARAREVPPGADGLMHPYRLLHEVTRFLEPDAAVIADGGDILSFARVALSVRTFLDCGALGCLGVGVPFANAAALLAPGRQVVAVIGDGSFGFTAMEIDTAVRQGLAPIYVIANNQAWNIEKTDQRQRFGGRTVGVDLPGCRYDLLAQSLGAAGRRVTNADDLPEALAWASDHAPAVLDVLVTQDAQSPDSLSGVAVVPPDQALTKWQQAEERRV
jgi:acetolactate synthase I/II/III large subunit